MILITIDTVQQSLANSNGQVGMFNARLQPPTTWSKYKTKNLEREGLFYNKT